MTPDAEQFHKQPDILEERLSAYLDDMLDADERAELEAHLATCDTCQRQLAELRQVRALLRAMPQPALPRSFALPVEEESAAAVPAQSPATPIPLRPTTRRQRVARMARAAQWLGTVAAVLGLAILISAAVLGVRGGSQASSAALSGGGATTTNAPAYTSDNSGAKSSPAATQFTMSTTPTAIATATQGIEAGTASGEQHTPKGTANGQNQPEAAPVSPLLVWAIGGGVLSLAGVALFAISSITRRRNRSDPLATSAASGN